MQAFIVVEFGPRGRSRVHALPYKTTCVGHGDPIVSCDPSLLFLCEYCEYWPLFGLGIRGHYLSLGQDVVEVPRI